MTIPEKFSKLEYLRGKIKCTKCESIWVGWISSKKKWLCWDCRNYMTTDQLYKQAKESDNTIP
jgi:hypothetical protein